LFHVILSSLHFIARTHNGSFLSLSRVDRHRVHLPQASQP
jgi:hypothetical protein